MLVYHQHHGAIIGCCIFQDGFWSVHNLNGDFVGASDSLEKSADLLGKLYYSAAPVEEFDATFVIV